MDKEERENLRKQDESDRRKLAIELVKYSHPLNDKHPSLHNICNGHVAPDTVNVDDALSSGSEAERSIFLFSWQYTYVSYRYKQES